MTEDESVMLRDLHRAMMEVPAGAHPAEKPLIQNLRAMNRALMEVSADAGPNDKPLIKDIGEAVRAYKRASWATRALIWLIPTGAAVGAAIQMLIKSLGGDHG